MVDWAVFAPAFFAAGFLLLAPVFATVVTFFILARAAKTIRRESRQTAALVGGVKVQSPCIASNNNRRRRRWVSRSQLLGSSAQRFGVPDTAPGRAAPP